VHNLVDQEPDVARIALFHPSMGVRPGILAAAERLRAAGHDALIVDQYEGRVFDGYDEADEHVQSIGFPALLQRALDGVASLDDGFLCVGFSNGGGMAEHVALHRAIGGAVLCSGALPLELIGGAAWPAGVPAQLHYTERDPRRHDGWAETLGRSVAEAGGEVELFEYPGEGHLFTDPSLPAEYDPVAAAQFWTCTLDFCERHGRGDRRIVRPRAR
jgi:dienelactone hydrolase